MPLRRKTRSSGRTSDTAKEVRPISPTSNGGRTHPKEMYAPDRATRSRTSSDELVILELPKSSRLKKSNNQATGKDDGKSKRLNSPTDRLNSRAAGGAKQGNDVNNSSLSSHNDGAPGGTRVRRRSGRVSGESSAEKEPRRTSPHVVTSSRSERRRRRSSTDVESESPPATAESSKTMNKSDRLRRRSSTSSEDRSPLGRQDSSRQTKTIISNNKRLDHPDDDDGNFKVPSVSSKSKPSEDVAALQESPRAVRRQATLSGKTSSNMDTVLSVDVTSHDALSTRTSPRRPKVSPRTDRTLQTNAATGKDSPRTREGVATGSKDAPVSPRTRGGATTTSVLPKEGADIKDAPDSARKRHLSGESLESDTSCGTHSSGRKRRKTGSACRDLTSQFEVPNSEQAVESREVSDSDEREKCKDHSVSSKNDTNDDDDTYDVLNAVNLQHLQDNGSVPTGSKSHRQGTSTPTNSPRKSRAKSPMRSPSSRRGLRSAGTVPDAPPDMDDSNKTDESKRTDSLLLDDAKSPESNSVNDCAVTEEERTDSNQGDAITTSAVAMTEEENLMQQDGDKIEIEDYEEFTGESWYEDVEDTELFYFESDHLALKGNRDYRMMLRTLATLEAQRKQAVQDLDLLVDKRRESLQNPVLFAQKLQKREDVGLPTPQKVVVLPEIEWAKYLGAVEAIEIAGFKHQTRGAKTTTKKVASNKPSAAVASVGSIPQSVPSAVHQLSQKVASAQQQHREMAHFMMQNQPSTSTSDMLLDSGDRRDYVRGRLPDPNKPATFNQLWTVDEQRQLEELLVKFPMEEVEARRWEKIAKTLGNRTSQQVASRVQKYFIKLTKAGLPVPGRIPNMTYYTNRKVGMAMRSDKRMHPFTKPLYQPSTFLQSIRPPVYMTDDDENAGWSGFMGDDGDNDDDEPISDDETIPVELRATEEYQELLRLKKMKKDRLRQQTYMSHAGFKCDGCNMEPIVGIRWHCVDCPTDVSTDLCQACVDCDFSSSHHSGSHQMEPIQYNYSGEGGGGVPSFVDTDYTRFTPSTGDYNYLDPNYNPSNMPT